MMQDLVERLAQKGISLTVTPAAKALAVEKAYDPIYGARPLKRYLQSSAQTLIAKAILGGDIAMGDTLKIDAAGGELICTKEPRGT